MRDYCALERAVAPSIGIGIGFSNESRQGGEKKLRSSAQGMRASVLEGKSILIAEDEALLAYTLADDLITFGCNTIGPFTRLAAAMEAVDRQEFDAAILDVNLNGEMVYPLADELLARGVPFVFLTGYTRGTLPDRLQACPHLLKPYNPVMLERELVRLMKDR
jgi:CheY-like chemotaxis protein